VPGFIAMWEYVVPPARVEAFERAYGPRGEWAQLFSRAKGYRGTELFRDRADPQRFLTIDYWDSEAAWEAFRAEERAAYDALDRQCETLTAGEKRIGGFRPVTLGPSSRL
jgi:heme-degrading monooxygenase HmoA